MDQNAAEQQMNGRPTPASAAIEHSNRMWRILAWVWQARRHGRNFKQEESAQVRTACALAEASAMEKAYAVLDAIEADYPDIAQQIEQLAFTLDELDGTEEAAEGSAPR